MKASANAFQLIKTFEGCKLEAYQDIAGIWTIGYGWTGPVDGRKIVSGLVISQQKADQLLYDIVKKYEFAIDNAITFALKQNQFDALISFVYNIGQGAFNTSTLRNKLNQGKIAAAADELLKWTKVNGTSCAGLVRRRNAERALFLS